MRKAILLLLSSAAVWAQPVVNPPVLPQCSATRTVNCTPRTNASGVYVPPLGGGGSAPPIGPAAGALIGTYPNPTIANLPTPGAVPVVSSAGVLGQSSIISGSAPNTLTTTTDNPYTTCAATLNVVSTTGYSTSGYLKINSEAMQYTGVTATSFTGVTCGKLGTSAAATHVTGSTVDSYLFIAFTDSTHVKYATLASGNVGIGTTNPIGKQQTVISATAPLIAGGATVGSYTTVTSPTANKDYLNKTGIGTASTVGDLLILTAGTGAYPGMYTIQAIIDANSIQLNRTCHNAGADVTDISVSISTAPRLAVGMNRTYSNALLSAASSNEAAFKMEYEVNKAAGAAAGISITSIQTAVPSTNNAFEVKSGTTRANATTKYVVNDAGQITAQPGGTVAACTTYPVIYSNAAFSAAASSVPVTLAALPARGKITGVNIKHSTAFAGTGVTSLVVGVGDGNTPYNQYASQFDIFQAVSNTAFQDSSQFKSTTMAASNIVAWFTANTNFGTLTAGAVDISVCWVVLP